MKLWFIWVMTIPVVGLAQTDRISLTLSNVTLEAALDTIAYRSSASFSYSDDVIPVSQIVSISVKDVELRKALAMLLHPYSVDFKISGRRIMLRKVPPALVQVVRGEVTDGTGAGVPGVNILLLDTSPALGTVTDSLGRFRLDNVPLGRISLRVSSIGYEPRVIRDLLLISGKEMILNVEIQEAVMNMDEVIVVGNGQMDEPEDGGEKVFNIEESRRFAGSLGDPARMASSYAGVRAGSDESNALIVRGNSPRGVLWRINGIEVPNPNHFATEGASNGILSVLSANVIDKTTLLSGAFPAAYGNALSAVMDVGLRNGNSERHEHSLQVGALGLEASTEGPVSSEANSSFLVNYRYSTLNLLDKVGVTLPDIGRFSDYQDLAVNFHARGKGGSFNVFGIGGKSNAFRKVNGGIDNDQSDVFLSGFTHRIPINGRTVLTTNVSWSGTAIRNDRIIRTTDGEAWVEERYDKNYIRGAFTANRRVSERLLAEIGVIATRLSYDFYLQNIDPQNSAYTQIINFKESGTASILQAFAEGRHMLSPSVTAEFGAHALYFDLTRDLSIEPRVGITMDISRRSKVLLRYGKHSRIENLQYYLARDHRPGGNELQMNRNLGFTRAHHVETGFVRSIKVHHISGTLYYQRLYNAPEQSDPAALYSAINEDTGFVTDSLTNTGNGQNYGVEVGIERSLRNGFYYLVNGSLYRSQFNLAGERTTNSSYDGNYTFHALLGKEFGVGRNSIFGVNVRTTIGGGRSYTPVDLEKSIETGFQVLDHNNAYALRLPKYFRADVQINFRRNWRKVSCEWRFDIQNVTNHRNTAYFYYDDEQKKIREKLQVGILPVFTWRVDF